MARRDLLISAQYVNCRPSFQELFRWTSLGARMVLVPAGRTKIAAPRRGENDRGKVDLRRAARSAISFPIPGRAPDRRHSGSARRSGPGNDAGGHDRDGVIPATGSERTRPGGPMPPARWFGGEDSSARSRPGAAQESGVDRMPPRRGKPPEGLADRGEARSEEPDFSPARRRHGRGIVSGHDCTRPGEEVRPARASRGDTPSSRRRRSVPKRWPIVATHSSQTGGIRRSGPLTGHKIGQGVSANDDPGRHETVDQRRSRRRPCTWNDDRASEASRRESPMRPFPDFKRLERRPVERSRPGSSAASETRTTIQESHFCRVHQQSGPGKPPSHQAGEAPSRRPRRWSRSSRSRAPNRLCPRPPARSTGAQGDQPGEQRG